MADYPEALKPELFDPGPIAAALGPPSGGVPRNGTSLCEREKKKWGITEITLSCAGTTSTSYSDPNHAPIAGGRGGRFFFAPLAESVKVEWKLKNPDVATTLTLELYRANHPAPIWSRTLDTSATQAGALAGDWDGSFPPGEWASFPDHLVTVEHSPYKLKAIAGANHEPDLKERWTYFDVLIEKIELTWGGKALIPPGNRGDIDALYVAQTQTDEQAINDQLALRIGAGGILDPTHRYEVQLPSNQFTTYVWDLEDGKTDRKTTLWLNHQKQWGDGPRIPLVAKIYVAKAAGGGVHGGNAAKALGGTKFLWDWESEDEIAGLGGAGHPLKVTTFLTNSLEYLRNNGECPPDSTNCHQEHGGKRGGTKKVFAPLPNLTAGSSACVTRKWATYEQAVLTGVRAGCVGVLFQPSRIALDTYVVSVYAPLDVAGGGAAALDTADAASRLRTNHSSLPNTKSGTFQILRAIRIRYVRKSAAVAGAVLASIAQEYRRAGIVIEWGTTQAADEALLAANYDAWYTAARQTPDAKGRLKITTSGRWFETNDQLRARTGADTSFGFIVDSWELIQRRTLADSTREYVNKNRKFNGPLRAYNRWLGVAGHTAANDHQYLIPYYQGLKPAKKQKVDVIYQRRFGLTGLTTKNFYIGEVEGAGVELARMTAEKLLVQINQHGMVIFHVETPVAFRKTDDTIEVPPSGTGGLSPSTSAQWQGRGSIHLVFLPQVPSTDPNAKYHIPVTPVITHEAGHNLFLCHAYAHDAANGGPPNQAVGAQRYLHDKDDLFCLMNYDQRSDHLCGFCNLKLRGWGTVLRGEADSPIAGPIEGGLVKLSNDSAQNRKP